jgi:hypothetical protein
MPQFPTTIQLNGGLDTRADGPCATGPDGEGQLVHLRQGDADGACGPYVLMMALLVLGLASRDSLAPLAPTDKRTRIGRFFSALASEEIEALFKDGTKLDQLDTVLNKAYAAKVRTEQLWVSGVETKRAALKALEGGALVIVKVVAKSGMVHWVLVVGVEHILMDGSFPRPNSLLALDSSVAATNVAPWNAWLSLDAHKGKRHPYDYVRFGIDKPALVSLQEALAIYLR